MVKMANQDYKNFEKWKNEVYENIKLVEIAEEAEIKRFEDVEKIGCSGLVVKILFKGVVKKAKKKQAAIYREKKYPQNADKAIADLKIRNKICSMFEGDEKLPIDIANIVTRVVWGLRREKIKKMNLNSMTVAYMSYKISKMGIENFCKNKGK
jgi:hypothetical protein